MRLSLMIYVSSFVGIIFHFLVRYRDAYTKKELFNWKDNILFSVYVLVAVFVMATFRVEISNIATKIGIDISQIADNGFIWFFIGYFGDSVWKNIEGISMIAYKPLAKLNQPVDPANPSDPKVNP